MTAYCRVTEVIPLKRKLFLVCFAGKEKFLFGVVLVGRKSHTSITRHLEGTGGKGLGTRTALASCGHQQWHTELVVCSGQEILEPRGWIRFHLGCFSRTWRKIWLI